MNVEKQILDITGKKSLPRKNAHIIDWLSWYRNDVEKFHNYKIFNGLSLINKERKSLGMAKYGCETWASLLLNEKCDIVIPDNDKKGLDKLLKDLDFWHLANSTLETSFALGLGALVIGVDKLGIDVDKGSMDKTKANITLESINAFQIVPISKIGNEITECAFQSVDEDDNVTLVIHTKNVLEEYVIDSYVYEKGNTSSFTKTSFNTFSKTPWFFILQPNIQSNFIRNGGQEPDLGISIFANAIDVMKSIDMIYDLFASEFFLKRPKVFFTKGALSKIAEFDNDGGVKYVNGFDALNEEYQYTDYDNDDKPFVQSFDKDFRSASIIEGLNKNLNLFAMKIGLGNFFKFEGGSVMTATQVISENSEMYRNVKKHEKLLKNILINFTKAIMQASNKFTINSFSDVDFENISVKFDDSIFEDTNTDMERDRADVNAGLLSPVEYRMRWYGEDERTANKNYAEFFTHELIAKYSSSYTQGLITTEMFVDKVYPEASNREEIIKYLEEHKLKTNDFDTSSLFDAEGSDNDDTNDDTKNDTLENKKED